MKRYKNLFFILFIVFLSLLSLLSLLYFYSYDSCYKIDLSYRNPNPLKYCLLLTMYINGDDKRREIYMHRLKRWLEETSFDIYTVESSGEKLNICHPRLKQFTFIQGDKYKGNSTITERDSILRACEYFQNDFDQYDIVFKITGKYFIPLLENVLLSVNSDAELIFQNRCNLLEQNTEIIGYKPTFLYKITKNIKDGCGNYEKQIKKIEKDYKVYRLPRLELEDFTKRGFGDILTYL